MISTTWTSFRPSVDGVSLFRSLGDVAVFFLQHGHVCLFFPAAFPEMVGAPRVHLFVLWVCRFWSWNLLFLGGSGKPAGAPEQKQQDP